MQISEWLSHTNKNQSDLARIINRDRARAHRILNGKKPNDEEMKLIFLASDGQVTPNDFFELPKLIKQKPRTSKAKNGELQAKY